MGKRDGDQKGAQRQPEGAHGDKAHARKIEELESGSSRDEQAEQGPLRSSEGRHRIYEQREQHDEADKNSEKNRLERDIDQHGYVRENFQVRGGAESHPAMPRSHINPTEPEAPNPSSRLSPEETPDRVRGKKK